MKPKSFLLPQPALLNSSFMITISMMSQSTAAELALHSINGESKIKNKLRPLKLPDNFPSDVVMQAFLQPNIAKMERNEFEWKLPRLHDIRMFCHEVMKVDGFVFFLRRSKLLSFYNCFCGF